MIRFIFSVIFMVVGFCVLAVVGVVGFVAALLSRLFGGHGGFRFNVARPRSQARTPRYENVIDVEKVEK